MFPFRFYSAYKEVTDSKIIKALSKAIDISVVNVPEFKGNTAVVCDMSGSMSSKISERSSVSMSEIAAICGAIAVRKSEESIIYAFAEYIRRIKVNSDDSVITNAEKVMGANVGYATYFHKVLEDMIQNRVHVDRIIVLSDMQVYGDNLAGLLNSYKRLVNENIYIYSIDLAGYGTVMFPEHESRHCMIGGWSERIFEYIPLFESDKNSMLNVIEGIRI